MSSTWSELGLKVPRLLLPEQGTDYEKWAVVACDQFTSSPEYWEKAEAFVGGAPSTLRLMLPEYYLGKPGEEERIRKIRETMESYLEDGTLRELPEGCVYVERTAEGRTRRGLVICVDLEAYDYSEGSTSLIRATEKTIVSRIPPRLRIRKGAPVELPHILILIDDPGRTVIEPLASAQGEVVYDTDLMAGGGHIRGTFLPVSSLDGVRKAFSALLLQAKSRYGQDKPLLMAMGDGNHSLATAKANWEEMKKSLTPQEQEDHPARYALCEIENIHDPGIVFEPIHRVLFSSGKASGEYMVRELIEILAEQNGSANLLKAEECPDGIRPSRSGSRMAGTAVYDIPVLTGGSEQIIRIENPSSELEVGVLQSALDELAGRKGYEIDYIHGEEEVRRLSADTGNAGFLLPAMDKSRLLPAVAADGTLPRKTFSMGEAVEKRYYMEARKLRPEGRRSMKSVDLRFEPNHLPKTSDPYRHLMSKEEITRARNFHRTFPQYAETPLQDLKKMAEHLGVGRICVKDESWRYGLNSFKVLGGAYSIARYLAKEMGRDISELSYDVLKSDAFRKELGSATFISATDGNHGRGVAWTARELGQRCIILMPKGTSKSRFDNIRALGAEVTIEDLNYDECVRKASTLADKYEHGVIVQDTSWEGYEDIPLWIMQGYAVMADEAQEQMQEKPTHVFVQAGVGAMAGSVVGYFADLYPDDPPKMIVVEPDRADCMFRGAVRGDGEKVVVTGEMDSIMAGLACGEPCELGWDLFKNHAAGFVSGSDLMTCRGMRMLAGNFKEDPHIVSGESGAATFGAFASIMLEEELAGVRETLGLGADSRVLFFSTEGDTDPVRWKEIVWEGIDYR